jgi:hypothetical protein
VIIPTPIIPIYSTLVLLLLIEELMVVFSETLITHDIAGIADNTLIKLLFAWMLEFYQHNIVQSLVYSKTLCSPWHWFILFCRTIVNNSRCVFGGEYLLETLDGYSTPYGIHSGLPSMDIYPPIPVELDSYHHESFK